MLEILRQYHIFEKWNFRCDSAKENIISENKSKSQNVKFKNMKRLIQTRVNFNFLLGGSDSTKLQPMAEIVMVVDEPKYIFNDKKKVIEKFTNLETFRIKADKESIESLIETLNKIKDSLSEMEKISEPLNLNSMLK
jgi:hypothetical protein